MKKKSILLLLIVLFIPRIYSQDLPKKQYLPKKGDFALGLDILPVFRNFSNTFNFNNNGTNYMMDYLAGTPAISLDNDLIRPTVSLMGKYMITDKLALRFNMGIIVNAKTVRDYVVDESIITTEPQNTEMVTDWIKRNRSGFNLSLGAEYRKGEHRLQGIFGGSFLLASQSEKIKLGWGNEMTLVNPSPLHSVMMDPYTNGAHRMTEYKYDNKFYLGVSGHIGIEYFIGPKIALGAEVSLTAYQQFGSQANYKYEAVNYEMRTIEEKTQLVAPGDSSFYFGTDSMGGAMYIIFYF